MFKCLGGCCVWMLCVSKVDCSSTWMFHVFKCLSIVFDCPLFECPSTVHCLNAHYTLLIVWMLNVEFVFKCVCLSLCNMWTSMVYACVRLHIHLIFMHHWVYMYLNVRVFESFFMFKKNHLEMNKASFHVSLKGFST